ncbi:hypothetical protein R3W88_014767 [Solanum pinnatisectum]|uniref:G-patch domain-containing protein n=1 Tax=Solanum pinnatisectum TaxID=50273 RepID=A0AAV9KSX1_9SOLN|nr:hypothetical protein R3W88_014767 [Solanum pinnatisectum]
MQVVRVNEEAEPDGTKLSNAAKIFVSEMLKYGYQRKSGLGPKSNGIAEPIHLKHQRGTKEFAYELASGGDHHGSSKTIFNWTISPSLFQPESCTHINKNPRSMVMTYNESIEQGESDEQDDEEYDESMMPENLPHEIEQVESQKKPNIDVTEVVNLGDEEIMKETRINIYLEAERKQVLIEFLKQYVDVFVWSYDDMLGLSIDIVLHKLPIDITYLPVK